MKPWRRRWSSARRAGGCGSWSVAERLRLSLKTLERYRSRLQVAHDRFADEAQPVIEKMTQYLRGKQWPDVSTTSGDRDLTIPKLVVNLVFADVKVMLPVLALRNPRIFVKPVGATTQMPVPGQTGPQGHPVQLVTVGGQQIPVPVLDAARAKEALVNWRWRELKINRQIRRCLVDALLAPFGVMRCGYTLATEKVAVGAPTEDGEAPETEELNTEELIKAESPFAVRWSPLDFRVDSEARYPDLSDAAWIAFGWRARLSDVKRNPRFRNTRDLKPNYAIRTEYASTRAPVSGLAEEDFKGVQLWEVWDKREHSRIVLADGHDKALEYDDWPQAYANFPAETLYFTEHPESLYGPPDLAHIVGQQDAYNEVASMILNHVKRFLRKYVVRAGAFDEKELEKLMLPVDGIAVETAGTIADSIGPVPDAPIPVDWWQTRLNFRDDHDRISGVADFMRGVAEKVDTATEASYLQSNLNVRTNDTRAIVEEFAERVSKQLLAIDAQTLDVPKAVPVIGPEGVIALGEYVHIPDKSFLFAETDVEVAVGSMQPIDTPVRKQDAMTLFGMFRGDPLTDQFELRQRVAAVFKDTIPDLDRVFLSREQFAQMQQQMAAAPQRPKVAISLKGDLGPTLAADLADGVIGNDTSGHPPAPLPTPPMPGGRPGPTPGPRRMGPGAGPIPLARPTRGAPQPPAPVAPA
jgi:hypothetical protein